MAKGGEYGGGYSKTDAARDTGSSTSDVSRAHHDARDVAAKEGGWGVPSNRHDRVEGDGGGCMILIIASGAVLLAATGFFLVG